MTSYSVEKEFQTGDSLFTKSMHISEFVYFSHFWHFLDVAGRNEEDLNRLRPRSEIANESLLQRDFESLIWLHSCASEETLFPVVSTIHLDPTLNNFKWSF